MKKSNSVEESDIAFRRAATDKKGEKIYYRYPTAVDDRLFYKRYRLCDDEDVCLIRLWHNRWTNVHLLELFMFIVELGGRGSSADTVDASPLSGAVRQNIRRTMVDLNMPPEGNQEGSNVEVRNADMMDDDVESHEGSAIRDMMMDQYEVNPDDGDDANDEPMEILDDGDEEEEMNYYGDTQIALTQPRSPEEDPSNEFEVGQQFQNKEEVMLAVKRYNIRRDAEYKIVESDQLRYNVQCIQFGPGCSSNILISYRRKQEKWEVRRYTGPRTCMQTSMRHDHRRLDSKMYLPDKIHFIVVIRYKRSHHLYVLTVDVSVLGCNL
ncbi:uncharacterized protein LOC107611775 [Arachis ipaensis]|uniref:uncharacterized protein LOC107611775 n=1 Tax=Arachis ipaensis TaxID=130454 RepID=UPI0007AF6FFB|nr:uncharacterized protein LOC107611775 [Arachis ipaensis]